MTDDIKRQLEAEAERFEREKDVERERVKGSRPKRPSQVYSIRLPVDKIETIRDLADRRDRAPSSMLREWILERLRDELSQTSTSGSGKVVDLMDAIERSFDRSSLHVTPGTKDPRQDLNRSVGS